MKLLVISNLYPPNAIGGYERLCFDVSEALVFRGHDVSVLTSGYGGQVQDYPGQRVDRSLRLLATPGNIYEPFSCAPETLSLWNRQNVSTLRHHIEVTRPDVVFVWNLFFLDPSIMEALQESNVRSVFFLTDNWLATFLNPGFVAWYFQHDVYGRPAGAMSRVWVGLKQRLRGTPCMLAGDAIFPSRFMRDFYASAGLGFRSGAVIPHGVRLAHHDDLEYADRSRLRSPGLVKLLFAGRVVEIKGVHTLIAALPEIVRTLHPLEVSLTVLGDSQDAGYYERIRSDLARTGLISRVEFRSAIAEEHLFSLFQDHDIYLFPSLYEPFSLTLIHALASGIPTAASSVGGNIDIVREGTTGLLFDGNRPGALAQRVVSLATQAHLRVTISRNARAIASEYTFDRMARGVEDFLAKSPR